MGPLVSDNRVSCYSVKVEIPNEIGRSESTYYLIRTDSEVSAISVVQEGLPKLWKAVEVNLTAIRKETVEALDLRPGIPRQI
jgi:hypothetical protein